MTAADGECARALAASSRLGYDVERGDPSFRFESPSDAELEWLADWLVSEGWVRPTDWNHQP